MKTHFPCEWVDCSSGWKAENGRFLWSFPEANCLSGRFACWIYFCDNSPSGNWFFFFFFFGAFHDWFSQTRLDLNMSGIVVSSEAASNLYNTYLASLQSFNKSLRAYLERSPQDKINHFSFRKKWSAGHFEKVIGWHFISERTLCRRNLKLLWIAGNQLIQKPYQAMGSLFQP